MTNVGDHVSVVMGSDGKYYAKSSSGVAVGDQVQAFIGSDGKWYASKSGIPSIGSNVLVSMDSDGRYLAHVSGSTHQLLYWGRTNYRELIDLPSGIDFVNITLAGATYEPNTDINSGFFIASRSDGTIVAWGNNTHDLVSTCPIGKYTSIYGGRDYKDNIEEIQFNSICAIDSSGYLTVWGDDATCPIEPGYKYASNNGTTWVAIKSDNTLSAWGSDQYSIITNLPVGTFSKVLCYPYNCVGVTTGGYLTVWGTDINEAITNKPTGGGYNDIRFMANGYIGIKSDNSLVAWGWNDDDYRLIRDCPVGSFISLAYVSESPTFCGVKSDGTLHAWGRNVYLQVTNCPVDNGYIKVVPGYYCFFALKSDGTISAWGNNASNQVSNCPIDSGYVDIYAGSKCGIGIKSNGSIVVWGDDTYNQVTDAPLDTGIKKILLGYWGFAAIKQI